MLDKSNLKELGDFFVFITIFANISFLSYSDVKFYRSLWNEIN